MTQVPRIAPACYPPRTRVSFQHPVVGLVQGVVANIMYTNDRRLSTHPEGLAYVIHVQTQDRGLVIYVKQPSDICVIH